MNRILKSTATAFIVLLAVYVISGMVMLFMQKNLIYHPGFDSFYECDEFHGYERVDYQGTRFLFLDNPDSKKVLVFYHGNGDSVCQLHNLKGLFESSGKSILLVEYDGYGSDGKKPSIKGVKGNVEDAVDFIEEDNFESVTVMGQSIGTSAAAYHASKGTVDRLMLISPFYTMVNLVEEKIPFLLPSLFLTERYDSAGWLSDYKGEVLIVHGDLDLVIPIVHGKRLHESLDTKKEFIEIKGYAHNNILDSQLAWDSVRDFIEN
jgi:pimeloyl-ACP methyl ester carboxylesterase